MTPRRQSQAITRAPARLAYRTVPVAFALLLFGSGCATRPPAPPPGIGDPRVASVVHAAHLGEVQTGQLALQRAMDTRVREYAQRMVDDHTAADQTLQTVEDPGVVTDPMGADLQRNTQHTLTNLRTYSGAAFDRAYIDQQVSMHSWVLHNLDGTLMPSARAPDMRAVLEQVRIAVADHLRMAQEIQALLR